MEGAQGEARQAKEEGSKEGREEGKSEQGKKRSTNYSLVYIALHCSTVLCVCECAPFPPPPAPATAAPFATIRTLVSLALSCVRKNECVLFSPLTSKAYKSVRKTRENVLLVHTHNMTKMTGCTAGGHNTVL